MRPGSLYGAVPTTYSGAGSIDAAAEGRTMSDITVKDSNGAQLNEGDSVTLIKDLKVKGTSETIKRGTLVKNIRLTGNAGEIECNTKQVKGLVLKTEFLKKA
jgi:protein PhnA